MRPLHRGHSLAPFALALFGLVLPLLAHASGALPRGDDRFWLGMTRAQVDSAVAARGDSVITDDTAFLVCGGGDPDVEYVQYSFFRAPHDVDLLWRVTYGYRHGATSAEFARAREGLTRVLGEPQRASNDEGRSGETTQMLAWGDEFISVSLGARWSEHPDPNADRMLVTWIDRRLQKLMQARGKGDPKKK
jgi:hypothetical protein